MPNFSKELLLELREVALGERAPDLLIRRGTLLNVLTEELLPETDIAIYKNRIAFIGQWKDKTSGETEIINAKGLFLLPGFIDPHCHLDFVFRIGEYSRFVVPKGTTTVITETAMLANAGGYEAVSEFIQEAQGVPLRVYILCPSVIPPFPKFETSAGFSLEAFRKIINLPFCLGLGETYWPRVVMDKDEDMLQRFSETLNLGKRLEGHTAGARNEKFQAYTALGISSCHEATNQEEALNLLSQNYAVMIRQGYIRKELTRVAPLRHKLKDLRNLMLCTDLLDPETLIEKGGIDWALREAIREGFGIFEAIKMVTLNPAQYFGLKDLGFLRAGNLADIILVEDLKEIKIKLVILNGKLVAENGKLLSPPLPFEYSQKAYESFKVKNIGPHLFNIPFDGKKAKVRAIEVVNDTITGESLVEIEAKSNNLLPDSKRDILKIAQIFRGSEEPIFSVGFLKGTGLKEGALASSITWDANNILVMGTNEKDMSFAVNTLLEHKGGMFLVKDGKLLASLPLPIWGIISPLKMEELKEKIRHLDSTAQSLGMRWRAFVLLQTLPFTGLPSLRLTEKGLLDVKKQEFVPLIVDKVE
jgi:adenine deaminase